MKVIVLRPHQKACIEEIDNDLASYQKLVGGYIEIIAPFSDGVVLVCNEEGKMVPLPPNRRLGREIICGTFYLTGQDEEGDLTSLSAERVEYYVKVFGDPEDIDPAEAQAAFLPTSPKPSRKSSFVR